MSKIKYEDLKIGDRFILIEQDHVRKVIDIFTVRGLFSGTYGFGAIDTSKIQYSYFYKTIPEFQYTKVIKDSYLIGCHEYAGGEYKYWTNEQIEFIKELLDYKSGYIEA
jgi:hypothetical protein